MKRKKNIILILSFIFSIIFMVIIIGFNIKNNTIEKPKITFNEIMTIKPTSTPIKTIIIPTIKPTIKINPTNTIKPIISSIPTPTLIPTDEIIAVIPKHDIIPKPTIVPIPTETIIKSNITLISASKTFNNTHVGHEWDYNVKINGININVGESITVSGKSITSIAEVIENDSIPDIGTNSMDLKEGNNVLNVTVTENRGRYSGEIEIWKFVINVKYI